MNLFVYGTLKRSECRAHVLAGQDFLAIARTQPRYRLLHCGDYPALVEASLPQRGVRVEGEVWSVDSACLARLDQVEGVSEGLFARREITLLNWPDEPVEAYFYTRSIDGLRDCGERW